MTIRLRPQIANEQVATTPEEGSDESPAVSALRILIIFSLARSRPSPYSATMFDRA